MNEGIATCRAMLGLLQDFPEFKFIRGEAAIYEYIERYAPDLFAAISDQVAAGRWDVVGGNWIQPDTNLPATEALVRQFVRGKTYFREKFGVEVTAAWAADSFGHSAGLPDILAAAGMTSFAFTRPQQKVMPLRQQAFWWQGRSGARILAYRPYDGWYASERAGISDRLSNSLLRAEEEGLDTVAMFYGLGNHGGGPSRQHLREIRAWAECHPQVKVRHSGLHEFFRNLRSELDQRGEDYIDTREGELNFCLRGCFSSAAKFKYAYRKAEAALLRAERTHTALGHITQLPATPLQPAWDRLLFNAFHDILPGSAIERAFDDQLSQIGAIVAASQEAETASLLSLASKIDTTQGIPALPPEHPLSQPILLWNPHPRAIRTKMEVEVALDYRPLWQHHHDPQAAPLYLIDATTGRNLPFQLIEEENDSMVDLLWRRRVVVPVELPPLGWTLLQMGLGDATLRSPASLESSSFFFDLSATPGQESVTLTFEQNPWLRPGLQVRLYRDTWGAWGGMTEEPDSYLLTEEIDRLHIAESAWIEEGPLRKALWIRFKGQHSVSQVEITCLIGSGDRHVELRVRALLADRGARLKLVIPAPGAGQSTEFSVPGGTVTRTACGEVPGGRWVRAGAGESAVGFASNALYGFDTCDHELRATIARSSRYGSDVNRPPHEHPWQPCMDIGEHLFRAILTPDCDLLPDLADALEEPSLGLTVPAHRPAADSGLPPSGSLLEINDQRLKLLSLSSDRGGQIMLRLQNLSDQALDSALCHWMGKSYDLGRIAPGEIVTWSFDPNASCFSRIRL